MNHNLLLCNASTLSDLCSNAGNDRMLIGVHETYANQCWVEIHVQVRLPDQHSLFSTSLTVQPRKPSDSKGTIFPAPCPMAQSTHNVGPFRAQDLAQNSHPTILCNVNAEFHDTNDPTYLYESLVHSFSGTWEHRRLRGSRSFYTGLQSLAYWDNKFPTRRRVTQGFAYAV